MSKNRIIKQLVGTALALFGTGLVMADSGVSSSAEAVASAKILQPVSIAPVVGLDFGSITAGNGGTVTVSPAGAFSSSGEVQHLGGGSAATVTVSGEPGYYYTVELPISAFLNSANASMQIENFQLDGPAKRMIDAGDNTLKIGATANVGANQAPGLYSGSFPVSVSYD